MLSDGHPALFRAIAEQLTTLRRYTRLGPRCTGHHAGSHSSFCSGASRANSPGSRFKCSHAFVRKFVHKHIRWKPRAATRATQKITADADQRVLELFVLLVPIFRDAGMRHGELFINLDQTQVFVANPTHGTYEVEGPKQVSAAWSRGEAPVDAL